MAGVADRDQVRERVRPALGDRDDVMDLEAVVDSTAEDAATPIASQRSLSQHRGPGLVPGAVRGANGLTVRCFEQRAPLGIRRRQRVQKLPGI
jgi:hypothetical protein